MKKARRTFALLALLCVVAAFVSPVSYAVERGRAPVQVATDDSPSVPTGGGSGGSTGRTVPFLYVMTTLMVAAYRIARSAGGSL